MMRFVYCYRDMSHLRISVCVLQKNTEVEWKKIENHVIQHQMFCTVITNRKGSKWLTDWIISFQNNLHVIYIGEGYKRKCYAHVMHKTHALRRYVEIDQLSDFRYEPNIFHIFIVYNFSFVYLKSFVQFILQIETFIFF